MSVRPREEDAGQEKKAVFCREGETDRSTSTWRKDLKGCETLQTYTESFAGSDRMIAKECLEESVLCVWGEMCDGREAGVRIENGGMGEMCFAIRSRIYTLHSNSF